MLIYLYDKALLRPEKFWFYILDQLDSRPRNQVYVYTDH